MKNGLKKYFAFWTFVALAMVCFGISAVSSFRLGNSEAVARKIERRMERRLAILDDFADLAMVLPDSSWMHFDRLPDDMVLYRYRLDTLHSWQNVLTVNNDDIRDIGLSARLIPQYSNAVSQLTRLDGEYSYVNLGSEWYVAKMLDNPSLGKVMAALLVSSEASPGHSLASRLPAGFVTASLSAADGSAVCHDGKPLFMIAEKHESEVSPLVLADSAFSWMALLMLMVALALGLEKKRSIRSWLLSIVAMAGIFGVAQHWGTLISDNPVFSPSIYAAGPVFSSLGALIILNVAIAYSLMLTYIVRNAFLRVAAKSRLRMVVYGVVLSLLAMSVIAYAIGSLQSLVLNSNLQLNSILYGNGVLAPLISIAIYTILFGSTVLLLYMLNSVVKYFTGKRFLKPFSVKSAIWLSLMLAAVFCVTMQSTAFRKEIDKTSVWANRLAIERDISMELYLRGAEDAIAQDSFICLLSEVDGGVDIIRRRIIDNYLSRSAQNYDVAVSICRNDDKRGVDLLNSRIMYGTPIAQGSRFYYNYDNGGHSGYAGLFMFMTPHNGLVRMLVEIESKSNRENREFASIFGLSGTSGGVIMPDNYSYAKYADNNLVSYRGAFAYPTILQDEYKDCVDEEKGYFKAKGYVHFVTRVAVNEVMIISRRRMGVLDGLNMFLILSLIVFALLCPSALKHRKKSTADSNSFKRKVNLIVLSSFVLSIALLVVVSVKFVFDRNKASVDRMLSSRISTVQTMVEAYCQNAQDTRDLLTTDFKTRLESISRNTRSDISVYSPQGEVFMSTVPDIYDRMMVGTRMDDEAYWNIHYRHNRFYQHKESFNGREYRAMYAPVFNSLGDMVAIVSTPYASPDNIMLEAIPHAILMIIIAIVLIALCQFMVSKFTDRLFGPLSEVSRRMGQADVQNLEHIEYEPDDEIASLVRAYNGMVDALEESSRELARSERDKAWSEMARQVAHEIKNPLTPIKLEIQRIVRLKQNGNPVWVERFDQMVDIVLEHIDILTETANEFGTFAKLYTQEPVEVDLDVLLQEQISIFDNKERIRFSYIGLKDALAMAPKPQLIRVFVNLLTNAVQSIDNHQRTLEERGEPALEGQILVCLRNSVEEGFYDITVEDNGPGVSEENLGRLFTPNFTTKTGGTGLGLAMCRNIIDKCGGEISYRRSFALSGACFIVRFPKGRS